MIERAKEVGISPSSVAAYLGSTGWTLVQDDDTRQNWVSDDPRRTRTVLLLPKDPTFADYDDVFIRALRRLERINNWDTQELYTQILSARSDILYIRADQFASDGTIPIREAQQLLAGAVEMVTAAARWTLDPRQSYRGRMPDAVKWLVDDDLRMGHTQHGSFVITVITRLDSPARETEHPQDTPNEPPVRSNIAAKGHEPLGSGELAPFPRRVMTNLVQGLVETQRLALEARSIPPHEWTLDIETAVNNGVTAQLCEALGDMTEQPGVQALNLWFGWAHAEQSEPPSVERLYFDRPTVPVLRDMHQRLAPKVPQPRNVTLVGYITRLERGADDEDGTVTVIGTLETGQERQVRLSLTGNAYAEAVQAHETRRLVEASGELAREGRLYRLTNNPTVRRLTTIVDSQAYPDRP